MKHEIHSSARVRSAPTGWLAVADLLSAGLPSAGLLCAGLLFASLPSAGPAAQGSDEAARAEARAVGAAGQATARGVATDAQQALTVPGFAGTNVPQTGHTDANMEAAARNELADPDSEGGAVGAFVTSSAAMRPAADIEAGDAAIVRGEAVQDSPTAPAWRAGGLTSGSVRECGRDLAAAQAPGQCGGVNWCVGADCERVDTPVNTGFVDAATNLNMVMEMGGDEFDRRNMRLFSGEREFCTIRLLGGQNCCTDSGVFIEAGLLGCEVHEIELAEARAAGVTHYLGEYCAKRILGICRRRDRAWCVFTSELGRILHEQARPQLGIDWANCDGLTVAQMQRIDFDRVDLSEFTDTLLDENEAPGISLPDADATGAVMRERIRDLYERGN